MRWRWDWDLWWKYIEVTLVAGWSHLFFFTPEFAISLSINFIILSLLKLKNCSSLLDRGHGTQVVDDRLQATVCGVVDRVNKLVTVRPLHRRYAAEIGDVIVGRVTEVRSVTLTPLSYSQSWSINRINSMNTHTGCCKAMEDRFTISTRSASPLISCQSPRRCAA